MGVQPRDTRKLGRLAKYISGGTPHAQEDTPGMEKESRHHANVEQYRMFLKKQYHESLEASMRLDESYSQYHEDLVRKSVAGRRHPVNSQLRHQLQTLEESQKSNSEIIRQMSHQIADLQQQVESGQQIERKSVSDEYATVIHQDMQQMLTLHRKSSHRIDALENELKTLRSSTHTAHHESKLAIMQNDLQGIHDFRREFSKNVALIQENLETLCKQSDVVQHGHNTMLNQLFVALTNLESQMNVHFGGLYGDIVQCVGTVDPESIKHIRTAAKAKMNHHLGRIP